MVFTESYESKTVLIICNKLFHKFKEKFPWNILLLAGGGILILIAYYIDMNTVI